MENNEDKTTIQLLQLDFKLINDAIRRLCDGTCCLKNDDEIDSARHLLSQMSSALQFHINIEEDVFESFAGNPQNFGFQEKFFDKMKAEHQHLNSVLRDIKSELQGQHSLAFHTALKVFNEELERHTELELSIPYTNVLKQIDPSTLSDIQARITRGYVD